MARHSRRNALLALVLGHLAVAAPSVRGEDAAVPERFRDLLQPGATVRLHVLANSAHVDLEVLAEVPKTGGMEVVSSGTDYVLLRSEGGERTAVRFDSIRLIHLNPKRTLDARLRRVVDVNHERTPLHAVLADLAERSGVEIVIDGDALKGAGYTRNMPVNLGLAKVPVNEALARIVAPYAEMVVFVDDENRRVVITTKAARARADERAEVKPPTGAHWRSLISLEELDAELADLRKRMDAGRATAREFAKSSRDVARDAETIRALMQVYRQHPDSKIGAGAAGIGRAAAAVAEAGNARDLRKYGEALVALDREIAQAPRVPANAEVVEAPKLVTYMLRFNMAHNRLAAAATADSISDETREVLERDAAIIAAFATLVAGHPSQAGETDFEEEAQRLADSATALHNVIHEKKPIGPTLKTVVKSCAACHASYR